MLSCVVNLSEGHDGDQLAGLAAAAGEALLDVHEDPDHNRSVLTLGSLDRHTLESATVALVRAAVARLDVGVHEGVHPRLGVADVVPFVPLLPSAGLDELAGAPLAEAVAARDRFAASMAAELGLPCFLYGPLPGGGSRTLPEVRRRAFVDLVPDVGPRSPHPSAGATCAGARRCLGAYNLLLADADLGDARRIAAVLRSEHVRALGFPVSGGAQVSCNLVAPWAVGPLQVYEAVSALAEVASCELVGLLPRAVVDAVPAGLRERLGISIDQTLEARLDVA